MYTLYPATLVEVLAIHDNVAEVGEVAVGLVEELVEVGAGIVAPADVQVLVAALNVHHSISIPEQVAALPSFCV